MLLGNYGPDRQESMTRFREVLSTHLLEHHYRVETLAPPVRIRHLASGRQEGAAKWLGYVDKYILFRRELRQLRKRLRTDRAAVVHICDHSNAIYVPQLEDCALVVTCHDLLAVRGALGEDTSCVASPTGRLLQKRILEGLQRAPLVACVSYFTATDLRRLLPEKPGSEMAVVPNGLNFPYRALTGDESARRLSRNVSWAWNSPFILHVGSNLPRKNKATLVKAWARLSPNDGGQLVFVGPSLTNELSDLARDLGVRDRVVVVEKPDNLLLEALYTRAKAFVFPSLSEGFGWPVIEAQACGCPVICSNTTSLPEVAGGGAKLVHPFDVDAIAEALSALSNEEQRMEWRAKGFENAARYSTQRMISGYLELYQRALNSR